MIIPRDYQKEAVSAARAALETDRRALVVIATGLGKTITSALVWKEFRSGTGIFLVHSNDILDHAIKEYRRVFPHLKLALFNGYHKNIHEAGIIFSTFQTMGNYLKELSPDYFDWMTVDETHHAQANSYKKVIEHFTCPKLGITATPDRGDLKDIRDMFGAEVYTLPLEEAIARGLLPEVEYHIITGDEFDQLELERIAYEIISDGRRVTVAQLNRRLFVPARDERVAEIIMRYNEKTVIFCNSIEHARHFKGFINHSRTYHSDMFLRDRRRVLREFSSSVRHRLLVVNAFNEGVDFPDVGMVVFYRNTNSDTIFRQQLGRGMRPGKKKLIVLDFVGNLERVLMLKQMAEDIAEAKRKLRPDEAGEKERDWLPGEVFRLASEHFRFNFSHSVVDLMKLLNHVDVEFYTYAEAKAKVAQLGIKSSLAYVEYKRTRGCDRRLPVAPVVAYADQGWKSWYEFLGKEEPFSNFYTYAEASAMVKKLKIGSSTQYRNYKKQSGADPRLPANPPQMYSDDGWSSWPAFLGIEELYMTLEEVRAALKKLGIRNSTEYRKRYKEDPRLPSNLMETYRNEWKGWRHFFHGGTYPTTQTAATVAPKRLRIRRVLR